jgi:subtilisin family serine protease
MLRKEYLAFVLILGLAAYAGARDLYVPGEIIIKYKPGIIRAASVDAIKSRFGVIKTEKVFKDAKPGGELRLSSSGKMVKLPDLSLLYTLTFSPTWDAKAVAEEFSRDPNLEFAEPNYYVHMSAVPNDTFYATKQWHLNNTGQTGGTPLADIRAEWAWDANKGSTSVVIGIVDSGIDLDHPDLTANLWHNTDDPVNGVDDDGNGYIDDYDGWDFFSNDRTPEPVPGAGTNDGVIHGTHVAGIVSAVTNNGVGVAGVSWTSKVMAVKILDNNGDSTTTKAVNGMKYAVDNGAQIINCSFGGPYNLTFDAAVDYIYGLGGLLVVSAGNDDVDIDVSRESPVCNDRGSNKVLGVASTDDDDAKSSFSNYGATYVDVCAPGSSIYSTYFDNGVAPFNVAYGLASGTSMSAPVVSGIAALLKSQNSTLTNTQLTQALRASADNVGLGSTMGTGRVNARAALALVIGTASPTAALTSPATNTTIYGSVTITGSATGDNFSYYKLEYGSGDSPSTWTTFASSESQVFANTLGTFTPTGLSYGTYTLKLTVYNLAGSATASTKVVYAEKPEVKIFGSPAIGPSPYKPALGGNLYFSYQLTESADIKIYVYDLNGNLVWQKFYTSGTQGGTAGTNTVPWNGQNVFGQMVEGGVYVYRVLYGTKIIGRGKLAVIK